MGSINVGGNIIRDLTIESHQEFSTSFPTVDQTFTLSPAVDLTKAVPVVKVVPKNGATADQVACYAEFNSTTEVAIHFDSTPDCEVFVDVYEFGNVKDLNVIDKTYVTNSAPNRVGFITTLGYVVADKDKSIVISSFSTDGAEIDYLLQDSRLITTGVDYDRIRTTMPSPQIGDTHTFKYFVVEFN